TDLTGLPDTRLRATPIEEKEPHLASVAAIDASALGISRAKHHRYLINDRETTGVLLYSGDEPIGYAYVANGHIGPLAVAEPRHLGDAFTAALNLAAGSGAPTVSAFLPGASESALSIAVEQGMRITFPMLLMSTQDFAHWNQYLPRNPGFM